MQIFLYFVTYAAFILLFDLDLLNEKEDFYIYFQRITPLHAKSATKHRLWDITTRLSHVSGQQGQVAALAKSAQNFDSTCHGAGHTRRKQGMVERIGMAAQSNKRWRQHGIDWIGALQMVDDNQNQSGLRPTFGHHKIMGDNNAI